MMNFEDEFVTDIAAGIWTSIKLLVLLVALALVGLYSCGCSTRTLVIHPDGTVNSTQMAFVYCPEATLVRAGDVEMISEASGVGAVVQALGDNAVEVLQP